MEYPIHPEKNASQHFETQFKHLFDYDEARIMELLESMQYGLGYLFVGFIAGALADSIFPKYDETKDLSTVFFETVLHSMLLIIVVFYVRKIVKIMPFLFVINIDTNGDGKIAKYQPYQATEYSGELMIALILVGSQLNLIKKIDLLSRKLYQFVYKEEKTIGISLGF
jgi:hypothetical protein